MITFSFLKLCKIKYYNYSPLYNVQSGFSFQTGDPLGPDAPESDGGSSIWGILEGPSMKNFLPDPYPRLKHTERGTVSMATALADKDNPDSDRLAGSQFIITLGDNIDYLDDKATVFGKVVEGFEVLDKINEAYVDGSGRPLQDIRLRHTIILDDPFPDPEGLEEPPQSPLPTKAQLATVRIADDEDLNVEMDQDALEQLRREREARAQALTLEMMGDLPFAEVKPPENILFVCKLNPVTEDEDLRMIFSRFGKILSCEVIRDKKTGDSLQYAFIEFDQQESCEQAYFKMQDVLIDDHRIHVDFSQSVSKISSDWRDSMNSRRRTKHGGGFGGIEGLERKRQYREEDREGHSRSVAEPEVVIDADEFKREHDAKASHGRRGRDGESGRSGTERRRYSRSRSPRPDRDRDRDRERDRGSRRDRSRERYDDRHRSDRRRDRHDRDDRDRRDRDRRRDKDGRSDRDGRDRRRDDDDTRRRGSDYRSNGHDRRR